VTNKEVIGKEQTKNRQRTGKEQAKNRQRTDKENAHRGHKRSPHDNTYYSIASNDWLSYDKEGKKSERR
jgi:hypothetical protein